MTFSPEIKILLQKALDGSISHSDLTQLVFYCRNIAEALIYTNHQRSLSILQNDGLSVSELALECIEPFFKRDNELQYTVISKFSLSLQRPLKECDVRSLFFALRTLLGKIVNAEIAKKLALKDPQGFNIRRNIINNTSESDLFELKTQFQKSFLIVKQTAVLETSPPYPLHLLEQQLFERRSFFKNTPQLFMDINDIFCHQEKYRRAIRVNDLVQLCKKYAGTVITLSEELEDHPVSGDNGMERESIREMEFKAKNYLKEKIFTTYVLKNKTTVREAEIVYAALVEMVEDYFDGDNQKYTYEQYLLKQMPLQPAEYVSRWKDIMEYLGKNVKHYIRAQFESQI